MSRKPLTPFKQALLDAALEEYGDVPEDNEIQAEGQSRRNRAKKIGKPVVWAAAVIALAVLSAVAFPNFRDPNTSQFGPEGETSESPTPTIDIGMLTNDFGSRVDVMYDKGYKTVDELMEAATLVVRATPVSVETESNVGICYVLEVAESSRAGVETIRLRQLKDEYQLELGQEVVLALQTEEDEGYYHIPGGGCGLFRVDALTGEVNGMLLDSLLQDAAAPDLETVFDHLAAMCRNSE